MTYNKAVTGSEGKFTVRESTMWGMIGPAVLWVLSHGFHSHWWMAFAGFSMLISWAISQEWWRCILTFSWLLGWQDPAGAWMIGITCYVILGWIDACLWGYYLRKQFEPPKPEKEDW